VKTNAPADSLAKAENIGSNSFSLEAFMTTSCTPRVCEAERSFSS
jgi:hypothetical protein